MQEKRAAVLLTLGNGNDNILLQTYSGSNLPMTITQSALTTSNPVFPLSTQEIDVELFTFIERYVTNLVRWDLLIFFGRHPAMHLEAHQVAQQIGRSPRLVQKELDDLVYLGIVRLYRTESQVRYGLTRSTATRRAVIRMARDYNLYRA